LSRYSGRLLSKTVSATVHKEILEEIYEKLRDHLPIRALEHGIAQNSIFGDLPGCYIADDGRSVLFHGVAVGQAEWDGYPVEDPRWPGKGVQDYGVILDLEGIVCEWAYR